MYRNVLEAEIKDVIFKRKLHLVLSAFCTFYLQTSFNQQHCVGAQFFVDTALGNHDGIRSTACL